MLMQSVMYQTDYVHTKCTGFALKSSLCSLEVDNIPVYGSSSQFPIAEIPEIFHKCFIVKRELCTGKRTRMRNIT